MRFLSQRGIGDLVRDAGGTSTVEFAMILPVLIILWIGGVEATQALSVDRRVNNLATAVADLAARSKELTYADVDAIFEISPSAMYPYPGDATSVVLTAIDIDADQAATVAWSYANENGLAKGKDEVVTDQIDETLRVADTQIIMAEVSHTHTPGVGYAISGALELEDRAFFVPRIGARVRLCNNVHKNCS